jgi:hypothetical protein
MSNTVYDIANVRVCQTCVIAFENGDTSGLTEEQKAKWERGMERENLLGNGWEWSGVQCDSYDEYTDACGCLDHDDHLHEGWFSWSWCECCGDTDGGQRYNVAMMRRIV